jgi:hypothetical protein
MDSTFFYNIGQGVTIFYSFIILYKNHGSMPQSLIKRMLQEQKTVKIVVKIK